MKYIGTKLINAIAMSRGGYNELRGWICPADEDPNDDGYLVEYLDGGQANVAGFAGYVSWSPKNVFEKSYRPITGLTFGDAIEALKTGKKVSRAGWNGKGMWLSLSCNPRDNDEGATLPCIKMKTATGEMLFGWLASQTDMLADDWAVIG